MGFACKIGMRIRRDILAGLLTVLALGATGCSTSPLGAAMPGRSLALDSPQQHELAERSGQAVAWYDARNDVKPSVEFGTASSTYQRSFTYTYDQLNTYDGRVYNNYTQTTYRQAAQETAH